MTLMHNWLSVIMKNNADEAKKQQPLFHAWKTDQGPAKSDSPLSLNKIIETGLEKGCLWLYMLALDAPHISLP